MENKLLTILSIVFSIISVVSIILVVILMLKPPKKENIPPVLKYCNLDVLNIGEYSIGVGNDKEQLIIEKSGSTNPKIVFNLMNRNRPLINIFNDQNYLQYTHLNTIQVASFADDSWKDVFSKYTINQFTCKIESVGSINFSNNIKLEEINGVLVMYGSSGQFEFNNNKDIFKIINLQTSNDGNKDQPYLYFNGSLCTNPENNNNTCLPSLPNEIPTIPSKNETNKNKLKSDGLNGISFSNGYLMYSSGDSIIIKGKTGTVSFNLNSNLGDLFTITDNLTNNYFYYNHDNEFGTQEKSNPNPPKTLSNVSSIGFTNGNQIYIKNDENNQSSMNIDVQNNDTGMLNIIGSNKQAIFRMNDERLSENRDIFTVGDVRQGGYYFYYNNDNQFGNTS